MNAIIDSRIDKWLWEVRVFKTRGLAADACRKGHVRIAGQPVKPARAVRINEVIVVRKEQITHTYIVLQLPGHRVGAPLAKECVEDQTPPAELQKPRDPGFIPFYRPKGAGRPTKKERREMEEFL
jgi:ribosome-associated heat shock protein Hsp15